MKIVDNHAFFFLLILLLLLCFWESAFQISRGLICCPAWPHQGPGTLEITSHCSLYSLIGALLSSARAHLMVSSSACGTHLGPHLAGIGLGGGSKDLPEHHLCKMTEAPIITEPTSMSNKFWLFKMSVSQSNGLVHLDGSQTQDR